MKRQAIFFAFILFFVLPFKVCGQQEKIVVASVFERLINAIGVTSKQVPEVVIVKEESHVASYIPGGKNEIYFELKAYRICRDMGADSLDGIAFILCHELGHWYNNHNFLNEASTAYASVDLGEQLTYAKKAIDSTITHELEADEFACYYSKMAGFSLNTVDKLIRSIYKGYNIPDSIARYPSLNSRCGMAKLAKVRMEALNNIFNIANILLLNQEYEPATTLYKHIINNKFGSREIKNNLGVCYAMQGLQLSEAPWRNLIFPFLLDPSSRAGENTRNLTPDDSIKMLELFKLAARHFKEAADLDPDYYPAQINGAVLKSLLGNSRAANRLLDDIEEKAINNDDSTNLILYTRALIDFISKSDTKLLAELAKGGDINAQYNLDRLSSTYYINQNSFRFPSSELALSLQPSIRKSLYTSGQTERQRNIVFYTRDTMDFQLVLLNITKPENKIYQLLVGKLNQFWSYGILKKYANLQPDFIQEFGPGILEKRCAGHMNYYTLKIQGVEVITYLLY
ncbi:MAG: M48 family metalloprotease [Bacteroidetes bacterium]|nr:M48 family metalloprotease [Bacteroidota bacterium]